MNEDNLVVINGFVFCATHGSELCNKCYLDHRIRNNMRMKKQLAKAFPKASQQELEERPPLSNALAFAMDSGQKDQAGSPLFQCKLHNTTDCTICFNWTHMVIETIKKASTLGTTIPIQATREDKLGFLASMGIELPPTTRLPEEAVDKKLKSAIDAAQYLSSVLNEVPVNPASFPLWNKSDPKNKPLLTAVRRGNPAEAFAVAAAGGTNPHPLFQNAFIDVRQTLMSMGNAVDIGRKEMIMQDEGRDYAICLRVLEVRKIAEGVPMFVVTYGRGSHNQPLNATMEWISDVVSRSRGSGPGGFPQIVSTPAEQNLLLTILNANSKRLSADYAPVKRASEKTFMTSFLLPIGPLSQKDIGKLSNYSGCVVCGKKTVSKCSGCLSVEYCGPECQKVHWKEHKPMCKTLTGGTWRIVNINGQALELKIASMLSQGQPLQAWYMNNQNPIHPSTFDKDHKPFTTKGPNDTSIAPNIHGDKPFLIKIQCPAHPQLRKIGGSMLIYDRQRSFQAHLSLVDDQDAYDEAMRQPEMGTKLKIYRWAKRVGENQLSVWVFGLWTLLYFEL
ncbi:hypothetical protein V5O48_011193 [Marasmius crinis-equi]|uniref:MYND-type domain-containing protein n=1 Tax=Marasmius crinis-equi TaxID=585013 RepID=A0ABR3F686_9AGAR